MDNRKNEEIILIFLIQNFVKILSVCVHVFDGSKTKKGTFFTPNYPSYYPPKSQCYYTFKGSSYEGIIIQFETFDLRAGKKHGCLNDYLEVYNVANNGIKHLIGRYCGDIHNVPKPLYSFQSKMEMRFVSNFDGPNKQFKGFNASFNFVPENEFRFPFYDKYFTNNQPPHNNVTRLKLNASQGDVTSPNTLAKDANGVCHNFINDQSAGYITSPGYPDNYAPGLSCLWVIRVEKYWRIYMRIEKLHLEGGLSGCNLANVKIYDGYENLVYTDTPLLNVCGNVKYFENEADRSYLTGRNLAVIKFETAHYAKGLEGGFKIRWVKVSLNSTCPFGILCRGSEACLNTSKHATCPSPAYFCIDKSLACNKIQDCPGIDATDEERCQYPMLISLSVVIPLIIVGSTILCLLVKFSPFKRGNKRRAQNDESVDVIHDSFMKESQDSDDRKSWYKGYCLNCCHLRGIKDNKSSSSSIHFYKKAPMSSLNYEITDKPHEPPSLENSTKNRGSELNISTYDSLINSSSIDDYGYNQTTLGSYDPTTISHTIRGYPTRV